MGQRSRKRARRQREPASERESLELALGREPQIVEEPAKASRSEVKNQAIREDLEPLADGERPTAVTVGAVVALLYAIANGVAYAAGVEVQGAEQQLSAVAIFSAIMAVAAWGMWNVRYWAVLGFQMLLALIMITLALSLLVATNVWAALFCIGVGVPSGYLFWKLVRAMARIQMPDRPRPR